MSRYRDLLNIALFVAALVGFLQPAFSDNAGLTQIVLSLFEPSFSQAFFMRWICACLIAASTYVFITSRLYRNVPLTVIRTDYNIEFADRDASKVIIKQEQLVRANRPDVTAYFSKHSPNAAGGRIPRTGLDIHAYCRDCDLQGGTDLFGSESSGFEIIHSFKRPAPFAWYMTLIPAIILNKKYDDLPRWLQKRLFVRRHKIEYVDEYNVENPVMSFSAATYTQMNITMNISFGAYGMPADLKVRRIVRTGVVDVHYEQRASEGSVHFHLDRLRQEILRITWRPDRTASPLLSGLIIPEREASVGDQAPTDPSRA